MKTGRLSKTDWHYIEENAEKMTPDEIAANLEREVDPVIKYLKRIGKTANKAQALQVQAEYDIKGRPYWKELKLQFSEDELELFLYHWKQIVSQFRKDVLATEELQIVDTIKLEILMNRALREQQKSMESVRELERDIETEKRLPNDEQDKEQIFSMERQIASLRAAKEALSREYKDLQTKKSGMFKELKATREQRIHKLENNKSTMAGLIEKILRDPDFFEEQGKYIEKMRMAMEKEMERLTDYHEYEDGTVDQPFMTPETVKD
ncbi:MAG: hypothetical protein ACXACW_10505 [Candidatus Hodarchaeales archaeon]